MSRVKSFLLTGSLLLLAGCSSQAQEQESPSAAPDALNQSDNAAETFTSPSVTASGDVASRLDQWLALVQATTPPSARAYADFLDQTPSWPERAVMMHAISRLWPRARAMPSCLSSARASLSPGSGLHALRHAFAGCRQPGQTHLAQWRRSRDRFQSDSGGVQPVAYP